MSSEAVFKFLSFVNEDTGIQQKIQRLANGSIHDLITLARIEGYDFNKDEFHSVALKAYKAPQPVQDELTEDDLEMVSGGIVSNYFHFQPVQTPPSIIAILIGL
jgi:predicted ribosomally synthesized peptide with nif11-like leader